MVCIQALASGTLDFDAIIEAINIRFPGTRIIEPDWYAPMIARTIEVANENGMPIPTRPLECLQEAHERIGVQREIFIPLRGGVEGRLDSSGASFISCHGTTDVPTVEELQSLIELLKPWAFRIESITGNDVTILFEKSRLSDVPD